MEEVDEKTALEKILDILNKAALDPSQGQGRSLSPFALACMKGGGRRRRAAFFRVALPRRACIRSIIQLEEDRMRSGNLRRDLLACSAPARRPGGRGRQAAGPPASAASRSASSSRWRWKARTTSSSPSAVRPRCARRAIRGARAARHPGRGRTLKIGSRRDGWFSGRHGPVTVYVTVPSLNSAALAGSGDLGSIESRRRPSRRGSPARATWRSARSGSPRQFLDRRLGGIRAAGIAEEADSRSPARAMSVSMPSRRAAPR